MRLRNSYRSNNLANKGLLLTVPGAARPSRQQRPVAFGSPLGSASVALRINGLRCTHCRRWEVVGSTCLPYAELRHSRYDVSASIR